MAQHIHIDLAVAKNRQLTALATVGDGKPFHLHSSVNPGEEAEAWAERMEITDYTLFLIIGAGLGYHIEALLQRLPTTSYVLLIFTQQEMDLLRRVNKTKPLTWFNAPRFHSMQMASIYEMGVALAEFMLNKMIKKVSLCRHFPSMVTATDQYQLIENELVPTVEQSMGINFNVAVTSGYHFLKNYWLNFSLLATYHGIDALKNQFRNIPVIIVGAGPSLDKNIHLLKECKDRVIIIAAGTAVSALVHHGIQPDFLAVCDVMPENYDVLKEYLATGAALVTSVSANYKVVANYSGSIYFFQNGYDYSAGSLAMFRDVANITQAVSVTTGAVDFAVHCGAKTVILIGQDLAYATDKEYAQGTKAAGYAMLQRIEIPGCAGQMVESNLTFKTIIDYYNQYVLQKPGVRFINATEGGALIAEMQQQTLQEVIDNVLPPKKIDKSFIHKTSKRKQSIKKILDFVNKMKTDLSDLHYKGQAFVQAEIIFEDVDIKEILASDEETVVKLQKLKDFYNGISSDKGYRYIERFMHPRWELVFFKQLDGMPIEDEYLAYYNLILDVQEILIQFLAWTDQNIKQLQEIRGGKS